MTDRAVVSPMPEAPPVTIATLPQRRAAEVPSLPGVMVYAETRDEALARVEARALRVLADRLEHGEAVPEVTRLFFAAA
jgi:predicted RNase H-like HicB family nuclease